MHVTNRCFSVSSFLCFSVLLLYFLPRISEGDRTIENEPVRGRVGIDGEISQSLKLESSARVGVSHAWFKITLWKHLQGVGV